MEEVENDEEEEEEREGEREEEHQQRYPREIPSVSSGEEDVKLDYQKIQMNLILSDIERKLLWDEYKRYVDEKVFVGLQNATLFR